MYHTIQNQKMRANGTVASVTVSRAFCCWDLGMSPPAAGTTVATPVEVLAFK
jgi:hypothetical protein